ncbi:MAG: hypothetical protein HY685_00875 [Chloroflexi bacterium]|nr:hypothetical protein [Chloroflexota bacterium]
MARRPIEDILDECLDRLQAGESVEACLARYPAEAAELEPLLRTASTLTMARLQPRPEFRQTAKYRFQGAVRLERERRAARAGWANVLSLPWVRTWIGAAAAVLVLFVLGSGTMIASADSLPDQPLYPVKRFVERAQLALAPSETERADLHLRLADLRVREIAAMVRTGKASEVDRLQQDLVRSIEMARSEAGVSSALAAAPVQEAARGAPAVAPQPQAVITATPAAGEEKGGPVPPGRAASLDERQRAFFKQLQERANRNLAILHLLKNQASERAKDALDRAFTLSEAGYREALRSTSEEPEQTDLLPAMTLLRAPAVREHGEWWVAGKRVIVTPDTLVNDGMTPGKLVVVGGLLRPDGAVLALFVTVMDEKPAPSERVELQGMVHKLENGLWLIDGHRVRLARETKVEGALAPGRWAVVEGWLGRDGVVIAKEIDVEESDGPVPFKPSGTSDDQKDDRRR